MAELVIELITLILIHLPVKSLLRFKSVSKEWYSLISSLYFINLHLDNHRSDNRFLIATRGNKYCLENRALDSNLTLTTKFFLPQTFDYNEYEYVGVVGSCRGLLLLRLFNSRLDHSGFVTWNPSTNNYMLLPHVDLPRTLFTGGPQCGFGFDKSTNDYKLVVFNYCAIQPADGGHSISNYHLIYSANRNSWGPPLAVNNTDDMNILIRNPAVVDDHFINWVSSEVWSNKVKLRGFDICTEEWLNPDLSFPDSVTVDQDEVLELGVLDNCLCLVSYDRVKVHVWVMKEYGVKESWTKLSSMSNMPEIRRGLYVALIMYSDGELLVQLGRVGSYFWYNLKDKTIRLTGDSECLSVTLCDASLVPVPVPAENGETGSFKTELVRTVTDGPDLEASTTLDLQEFLRTVELDGYV